ncbi:DUF3558 domain-containing protein [Prauserella isguenensis]|uniref:DUF3558 domain-containing protein n=1 Tax=Prauserella isguenensis TaxID=1470180 RepID=UPI001619F9F5
MRSARAVLLPLVTLAVVTASACSERESGTPEANGMSPSSTPPAAGPPSTDVSAPNDTSPLAGIDPCSLLTTAEVEKHGAVQEGAPENKTVGTATVCTWPGDAGDSAALVPTTSVAIRQNAGVQDVNDKGSGVQHTEEDGRKYARSPGPGGCVIAIGVTTASRVDVVVSGTETADQACQIANSLVEAAEPNVPRG